MLVALGVRNAPVFMQGFVDGEEFRFYDPGLRFPGGDYDRIFASVMGVNLMKLLIELAFTGKIDNHGQINEETVYLKGTTIFTLHSTINTGTIARITDRETLLNIPGVCYVSFRHGVNDRIEFTGTVNQRIAEFNIFGESSADVRRTVSEVIEKLVVLDEDGKDMVFCKFDLNTWRECKRSNI